MATKVGFVGLGLMGSGMAHNILKAGFPLIVYDTRREAMQKLVSEGAKPASDAISLAKSSEIVMLSLPTPEVSEEVVLGNQGLLTNMVAGSVLVEMSTVPPSLIRRFEKAAKPRGVEVLDCPVAGGPKRAAEGTLDVFVGGEESVFKSCESVLHAVSKTIYYVGGPGAGETTKLLNNLMVHCNRAAVIETLMVAAKARIDLHNLYKIVSSSTGQSWIWDHFFPAMASKSPSGVTVTNVLAVVDSIIEMARDLDVELPVLKAVRGSYLRYVSDGLGPKDMSEISKNLEKLLGVGIAF